MDQGGLVSELLDVCTWVKIVGVGRKGQTHELFGESVLKQTLSTQAGSVGWEGQCGSALPHGAGEAIKCLWRGLWTSTENLGIPHAEVDGPTRERARGQRTGEGNHSAAPAGLRANKEF